MEQIRIGLIGVGRFCPNYHIPNLIQRRDVEITAVCDISQDRLDNLPESLCASQTSRDYRDLLDPDLVDGVVVSTPNQYHYEQCKLALERRIPVLVDKPTTVTVAHAKELTTLSQSQECLLMTAFTRRFMASTEYVRSQLASSPDDIQYMTAVQRRAGGNLADGGMLHTRTVHILDVLPWLVGQRIVAVAGTVAYEEAGGVEDFVDVRLDFSGGLCAHLLCIKNCDEYEDEVTVYSARKSFRLERNLLFTMAQSSRWEPVENPSHQGSLTGYFVDVIQGKKVIESAPSVDPHSRDGLQTLRVVEAIHEAGRTGRSVAVPLSETIRA